MFNVRVINLRKLLKLAFIIILIFILYAILSNLPYNTKNISLEQTDLISDNSDFPLIIAKFIFNQNIPGLSILNNQSIIDSETSYLEGHSSIQYLIGQELSIIKSTKLAKEPIDYSLNESVQSDISNSSDSSDSSSQLEHAPTNVATTVIENNVPNKYTDSYNGVSIKNGTNYSLTEDILNPNNIDINKNDVMIFHTHTCESYTPTENYTYEESGTFRTTDLNFSVSRVGDALSDQLLSYGFNVTHDKTYHDYPAYSGSYGRSQATVENLLVSHPGTDIIIDLHRDAITDTSYAPSVIIGDETVAQLMFVIGTDGGGLEHPNWQQNLKFAVRVQEKANELYPGLFRPILLRNSRYNQQLGKAACIIEVGATGNTLEQAMGSMKYLSKILDEVLKN